MPVFFPPEGRLGHAPVHAQPVPVEPLQAVVFEEARFPQRQENAVLDPFLEAIMRGGAGAELGGIQRLPLATGAQDEEDGVHADAIGRAWPATAEAMGVHIFRQVHLDLSPKLIGNAPLVGYRRLVHDGTTERVAAVQQASAAARSCYSFSWVIRIGS